MAMRSAQEHSILCCTAWKNRATCSVRVMSLGAACVSIMWPQRQANKRSLRCSPDYANSLKKSMETTIPEQLESGGAPGARLMEVAALFARLGCTAFGGPAAHIAMMRT